MQQRIVANRYRVARDPEGAISVLSRERVAFLPGAETKAFGTKNVFPRFFRRNRRFKNDRLARFRSLHRSKMIVRSFGCTNVRISRKKT